MPDQRDSPSQHDGADTPDASEGAAPSNKRKRGAAPSASSRGVANLTPEQLERKRANDREAQRAIRERTKQQIERLNERIRELESSQPYRELQAVLQQKEAVQAENEEIKRQLASFMAVFQRYTNMPSGLEGLAAAAERNAVSYGEPDMTQGLQPQEQQYQHPPPPQIPDHTSPHGAPSVDSPVSQTSHSRPYQYAAGSVQQQQNHNPNRSWVPQPSNNASFDPQQRNIHPDLAYSQSDERLGVDFLLDGNPQRMQSKPMNGIPPSPQSASSDAQPHWSIIPKRVAATCPLDAILLDAVAERQRARAAGAAREDIAGPIYPNWNHLLNKHTSTPVHPISKLITDITRTFPDLDRLPEQVAVIYIMFLITRWQADPTRENYELLPEWVRPIPSQLFTPHPCWLDYLPWPRLRDAAVQSTPFPNFDTFFVPYTTTLRLNWPYAPTDVLLPTSGPPHPMTAPPNAASPASTSSVHSGGGVEEPVWKMNPAFETHLRDIKNWSLGKLFRDTYPEWATLVGIK